MRVEGPLRSIFQWADGTLRAPSSILPADMANSSIMSDAPIPVIARQISLNSATYRPAPLLRSRICDKTRDKI